MIVDCHTHIWENPQQLGPGGEAHLRRQAGQADLAADPAAHLAASQCVDVSFVLGFFSRQQAAEIPNRLVADYVAKYPKKLVGLAGVDPLAGDAADRLAMAAAEKAFIGVTISPAAQGFHPADSRVQGLYQFCSDKGLVVIVHQDSHLWADAKMEFARPYLWDEVLRDYPKLRMVIAHLGHPWVDETISLLAKHANLYADIASLLRRPWHAYNVMVRAHEYASTDKLLFGSDFPFLSASESVESVYRLNEVTHGTRLPAVPREILRSIVERNALACLGVKHPDYRAPGDS
ncbi:MAG: amidohydrolase family protein [Planctomycetes bacterium]|nr:amidohydrolase family protein [Planctomycetota bacterium]